MGDGGIPGLPPNDGDISPPSNGQPPVVGPPITSVTTELNCGEATDFPREHFDRYFRDVFCVVKQYKLGDIATSIITAIIIGPIGLFLIGKDVVLAVLQVFVPPLARAALSVIDGLRKTMDTEFAELSVVVLGELLGADLDATNIPSGKNFKDHVARAEVLGSLFHNLLLSEFAGKGEITPQDGVNAATRFSGLLINFGTATGVIAALGGMIPIGHFAEIREIGEEVAKNLGLGRLHRMAMRPLFTTLIATPYQWALNLKYRPTQFTAGELVNPYTQVLMDDTTVHDALARAGYSDDKIKKLIQLHQKRLTFADLFDLHNQRVISDSVYQTRSKALGIGDQDLALFQINEEQRIVRAYNQDILTAAAEAYRFGNITRDELEAVARQILPVEEITSAFMLAQDYKRKAPHRSLTVGQIEHLFEIGIFDLNEFDDRLSGLGFSDDDVGAIRLDILLKLNKQAEAQKAKDAAAAKKAAAAAAKIPAPGTSAP